MSRRWAVIVDIDGTIADKNDRSPYDYSKVSSDSLIVPIADLVEMFDNQGYWILYVSGRSDECREATERWLTEFAELPWDDYLFMRKEGDYRPDTVVKREIYEQHIENEFEVLYVLDDRNSVVKMWREELGLTVLQVADGDF